MHGSASDPFPPDGPAVMGLRIDYAYVNVNSLGTCPRAMDRGPACGDPPGTYLRGPVVARIMPFPSAAWAEEFRTALNANEAYRAAAQAWVGDILLRVRGSDPAAPAPGVQLVLAHGECSAAVYYPDAREVSSEFVYEGSPENWERLLCHELDPVKGILDGTFRIKGNLAKAMRFTRAAAELVGTAAKVPSGI